jgi:ATP-dependent exoDNAse (exonuclease V) beta subunit
MISMRRATDAARDAGTVSHGIAVVQISRSESERPAGARFGTLVHALMAALPLYADHDTITQYANLCARVLGASDNDAQAAADAAERALAHSLLRRAASAEERGECRRETPVTLKGDSGELIEGVVDLAFAENGTWHVVDFKTDADLADEQTVYEKQVALYASAIAKATGQVCNGTIVRL